MVSNLDKEDVVIVLISGGGSALLSMTIPGLKLDDKLDVIKLLSRAGADIVELNTVRKALSFVKGGKLSQIIAPAQVTTKNDCKIEGLFCMSTFICLLLCMHCNVTNHNLANSDRKAHKIFLHLSANQSCSSRPIDIFSIFR